MNKTRIILADDHLVVRMGLSSIISLEKDMEIVAEAESGDEAVALARKLKPDVIVMDLMMPGLSGAQATAAICANDPVVKVLILTTFPGSPDLTFAMKSGAKGALAKATSQASIIGAIRAIAAGERVIGEGITLGEKPNKGVHLSPRQREILSLAAKGLTSRDIAATLGISYETVKDALKKIFDNLNASTRAEAVSKGLLLGLISG